MSPLLSLVSCIIAIAIVAVVVMRLLLKKKSNELSSLIESITPFQTTKEAPRQNLESIFTDIESDLEQSFNGRYITFREARQFTEYYTELFHEVCSVLKRLATFHVEPSYTTEKFVSDFENLQRLIKTHNDNYIEEELDTNKEFLHT